jgi:farnesyl-diphosphate farnesyltransferase
MPGHARHPTAGLLTHLLRDVSRSFYRTLRILPRAVREPIGLAYLLARTADTIADTPVLPSAERLDALESLRNRILGVSSGPLDYKPFLQHQASPPEHELLVRVNESLELLGRQPLQDRTLVQQVLAIITRGQQLDLERFGQGAPGHVVALQTEAELDDYTWRVAGCVGEFWTRLCQLHLFPEIQADPDELIRNAIRFGKGLQRVNILRDLAADLRIGRCYIPEIRLRGVGLSPVELLDAGVEPRLRPLYQEQIDIARLDLQAGWRYTNSLPTNQLRLRLACAWPVLIGIRTLARLETEPVLDPHHRVKISRPEVRGIILRSILRLLRPDAWRRQFKEALRP